MNQLKSHNLSLRDYLELDDSLRDVDTMREMADLDLIDSVLRSCLSIEDMREAGCFFTGSSLAKATLEGFSTPINSDAVVLDPTCGAGNLLIICSRELEVKSSLSATLEIWGKVLWGFDIHRSFIEATKLRLIVEALYRGARKDCSLEHAFSLLSRIVCRDAMSLKEDDLEQVTHAIMNPPFSEWASPNENYWKKGKVNAAGVIFDKYLRILPTGCFVSAILPDVLRSGSRYGHFRDYVNSRFVATCRIWGRFNTKTDVDVFVLSGTIVKLSVNNIQWQKELNGYTKLSEKYDVRIGPLVAYRDPEEGREYPYIHPKNCPTWGQINTKDINERRKFKGHVCQPPFVVVKRTSSPSDRSRAAATIINVNEKVAVENHMIVITPKSNKLKDCKELVKILKSRDTNDFLNNRVRMRHLTVSAIKDIPI
ncbi:N-6 DNA methylase [Vibrio cholerae]|uniref:N-6 DNA methylase n=1 Tax=Vibrio cholerae TaxID=666 RepID=UPI00264AE683|nr:N-6 DNA methylase [Vibrio cholerae]MDN6983469.1 SAM-dependent DNA methyltransferase [Vibrio cholerae]